jgi:hypothetical protein
MPVRFPGDIHGYHSADQIYQSKLHAEQVLSDSMTSFG